MEYLSQWIPNYNSLDLSGDVADVGIKKGRLKAALSMMCSRFLGPDLCQYWSHEERQDRHHLN